MREWVRGYRLEVGTSSPPREWVGVCVVPRATEPSNGPNGHGYEPGHTLAPSEHVIKMLPVCPAQRGLTSRWLCDQWLAMVNSSFFLSFFFPFAIHFSLKYSVSL